MKRSFFETKLSQVGVAAAVAGLFATAPMQAQAVALQFKDLNPTGGFITLDKLNTIASPQNFHATTDVGINKILDNGDTFTSTFNLLTNSSSLGAGATNFNLGGDYRFEVALNGVVTNAMGAPITLNPDDTVTNPAGSSFGINFTSATIGLFDNITNTHITDLMFQSGGGSDIRLLAGSFIGDITLNTLLGGANCTAASCDPYILDGSGGSLTGAGLELLTITTGSERFLSFDGSIFADNRLQINFQDNGQSTTFVGRVPEPASLALIGIGLLGFAATGRKKKFI
ncbi:PEP-CTERM sorting domain-containing protein [Nitrosospira multiformis]|uniref:PEP-CTERM protein-sorting domain-containing protein n=1 Tax=Nitrosospira multiformis TaxID=1231 RepID=A0A1I7FHG6_9PROT|nr:PEP-CTERM sorting domain-containing protein [Nitrosospira multiformis]SFU35506.1 PEP-CTERM protein-sorting domain-containing protein [Nitrosospira multiformis]